MNKEIKEKGIAEARLKIILAEESIKAILEECVNLESDDYSFIASYEESLIDAEFEILKNQEIIEGYKKDGLGLRTFGDYSELKEIAKEKARLLVLEGNRKAEIKKVLNRYGRMRVPINEIDATSLKLTRQLLVEEEQAKEKIAELEKARREKIKARTDNED